MNTEIIMELIQGGHWLIKMAVGYSSMVLGYLLLMWIDKALYRLAFPRQSPKQGPLIGNGSLGYLTAPVIHHQVPGPDERDSGKDCMECLNP